MKISVAGFRCAGTWEEVVAHGDRITEALKKHSINEEALRQWNQWRPSKDDSLSEEVTERTVKQASTQNGKGEKKGISATEDVKKASQRIAKSSRVATKVSPKFASRELRQGAKYAARAVDSASRKILRRTEEAVYEHLMTSVSPCYFDNKIVSANIMCKSGLRPAESGNEDDKFVFEININNDDLREAVRQEFSEELEE